MDKSIVFPGRIVFDHLAKTGGMAVTAWLRDVFGSGVVSQNVTENHLSLIRGYGGVFSILSAHTYFQGEGLDPRYQYVTLLREPVDRVVSWLFYAENSVPDSQEFKENKNAAKAFLESEGKYASDVILNSISNYYVDHFSRIDHDSMMQGTEQRLSSALKSLKKFDVVGVYDDMPQFLTDVSDLVGIVSPLEIARVNVTHQRPKVDQISSSLRERITALNELDLRLYAEVVAWKASAEIKKKASPIPLTVSKWKKYDLIHEHAVITPDIDILTAVLREGYDIRHGQLMTFDVEVFLARKLPVLEMGIHIFDSARKWAFGINSTLLGQSHQSLSSGSYRVSHHLIADLPSGKYTAGFAFTELLSEGRQKVLAWYDVMCEFQIYHQVSNTFIGYSYLPAEISLCQTGLARAEMVVCRAQGSMLVATPASRIVTGEYLRIGVIIVNRSEQAWVGDRFRPVNLSYHWLNGPDEILTFDGERTALPAGGVGPGQSINVEMLVAAPPEAGRYNLVLTMVQENVGWFEEIGFEPARLIVEVIEPVQP